VSVEGLRKRVKRLRKKLGVSKGLIKMWRGKRVVALEGWNEWKPGAFKVFPDSFIPIAGDAPDEWVNDWVDLLTELKDPGLGNHRCFDCVIRKASELRVEVEERRRLRDENRDFYERELSSEKSREFERQDRLKVTEYRLYNDVGGEEGRVCPLDEEKRDFFKCPFGDEAEALVEDGRAVQALWRHLKWYDYRHWQLSTRVTAGDETPLVDPADYNDILKAIDDGRFEKVIEEHEAYMKETNNPIWAL